MKKVTTKENKEMYFEGVGRRKTSTARVRVSVSEKNEFVVNDKSLKDYFATEETQKLATEPLDNEVLGEEVPKKFSVTVKVSGGGVHSQAEAVRHGLARALVLFDSSYRGKMKSSGFLKRDARAKERRKFGLKKARKAPQWSKR